jgi:hypothetical protein
MREIYRLTQMTGSISAGTSTVLTEFLRAFPQSFQENAGTVHKIRRLPLPFTSPPVHHSFIVLPFYAMSSELLIKSLNKKAKGKAIPVRGRGGP